MNTESTPRRRRLPSIVLIGIAVAIVVGGLAVRWLRAEELDDRAAGQAFPTVAVVSPSPVNGATIELPGRTEAWVRAPIHARVSGYLRSWSVDIGEPVTAGQVLAVIEAPDVDETLLQARAELASARSEAALASTTARRWQSLAATELVSRQETDEKVADLQARQAQANALQANVDRLRAMQRFTRLVAPFDGVVTARNTDVGALINGGMTTDSELFEISDVRRLRVYVNVPQSQVASIREGAEAQLTVPERPSDTYTATVQSMGRSIDASSGAMRVQLAVDNSAGELLPGGFATVRFGADASSGSSNLGIPPSALIVGKKGVQVATLDGNDVVRLRDVRIASDHGNVIELSQGVTASDQVIANPPDGLRDGSRVRLSPSRD